MIADFQPSSPSWEEKSRKCHICDLTCDSVYSLRTHLRKLHDYEPEPLYKAKVDKKCFVPGCNVKYFFSINLVGHIERCHPDVQIIQNTFINLEAFMQWKEKLEEETSCRFIRKGLAKENADGSLLLIFSCHKSGTFKSMGDNIRKPKPGISCKINTYCPAVILAKCNPSGIVECKFQSEHVGHVGDVKFSNLHKSQRATIASCLVNRTNQEALDEIKKAFKEGLPSPLQHLTLSDMKNIRQEYNLSKHKYVNEDAIRAWILSDERRSESEGRKPICRFVKFPGDQDYIPTDYFILILMTDTQQDQFITHAHRAVIVDTIRGYAREDIYLTSIFVINDNGDVCPCAFMYSSVIDADLLNLFFETLKACLQISYLSTKVFLSNDHDYYYKTWLDVMGDYTKNRMLNTWNVDEMWTRRLDKLLCHPTERDTLLQMCRDLRNSSSAISIYEDIESFVNYLLSSAEIDKFGLYFKKVFSQRPKKWAMCFRGWLAGDVNTYLENWHYQLQELHQKGRKLIRFDDIIELLLILLTRSERELLIRDVIGSISKSLSNIKKSHKDGISSSKYSVLFDNARWRLYDSLKSSVFVIERQAKVHEGGLCSLHCEACQICVHDFKCSCVADDDLHNTICQHVHFLIHMSFQQTPIMGSHRVDNATAFDNSKDDISLNDTTLSDKPKLLLPPGTVLRPSQSDETKTIEVTVPTVAELVSSNASWSHSQEEQQPKVVFPKSLAHLQNQLKREESTWSDASDLWDPSKEESTYAAAPAPPVPVKRGRGRPPSSGKNASKKQQPKHRSPSPTFSKCAKCSSKFKTHSSLQCHLLVSAKCKQFYTCTTCGLILLDPTKEHSHPVSKSSSSNRLFYT